MIRDCETPGLSAQNTFGHLSAVATLTFTGGADTVREVVVDDFPPHAAMHKAPAARVAIRGALILGRSYGTEIGKLAATRVGPVGTLFAGAPSWR